MFKFWQSKPKNALAYLSRVVQTLENGDDFEREKFLRKNMDAIKTAMANDPGAAEGQLPSENLAADMRADLEAQFGFLDWRYTILMELLDENEGFNSNRIPFAAEYFLTETAKEGKKAFDALFAHYPDTAMLALAPAMLFRDEILTKMDELADHEDPHLYFTCADTIDFANDKAGTIEFTNRMINSTLKALTGMLSNHADKVWFSSSEQGARNYLSYLPEGTCKNYFITDNMQSLIASVKSIAPTATNIQLQQFEDIYNSFAQDARPTELEQLKKLLISERIKLCFRVAADPFYTDADLAQLTLALDAQPSELIESYAAYDDMDVTDDGLLYSRHPNPFIPAYEFLRLENPSSSVDAEDKNEGVDSRYLWMVKKSDRILVAAFTKADVTAFLAMQTGYVVGEMPTAAEWQERFCYQNTPTSALTIER